MFRRADVVCLCLMCILWQFSMLHSVGAFTPPVRTECGMYAMYCMQCCMSESAVF